MQIPEAKKLHDLDFFLKILPLFLAIFRSFFLNFSRPVFKLWVPCSQTFEMAPLPLITPLGSTLRHRENLASIKLGQIFMHFYLIKGIESSVELRPSTFITRIGAAQVNSRTDYVLNPFTQGGTAPPPPPLFFCPLLKISLGNPCLKNLDLTKLSPPLRTL